MKAEIQLTNWRFLGSPVILKILSIPNNIYSEESYKVVVKAELPATGRVLFEAEKPIIYDYNSLSIFILFDKPIYIPRSIGNSLRFLCWSLNTDVCFEHF